MPHASKPVKVEMYPIFAGYEPNHKCVDGILEGKNSVLTRSLSVSQTLTSARFLDLVYFVTLIMT